MESSQVPRPAGPAEPAAVPSGYREAVGVIHVHSTYSDGQLPVEPIVHIAQQQGLDFLILTDHNTLRGKRERKEGFHGKTLLLIGSEISSEGHYLALRIQEEVPQGQKFQPTVDAVTAQGGLGFIAHPLYKKKRWDHFELQGFTGMEIYNAKEDVLEEGIFQVAFWTFLTGLEFPLASWIDRPDRNLKMWDRLLAEGRPVVGIGSPNAHGLRWFGMRLGSYETLFKLVRNHLWISGEVTEASIYEALEKGRLFVAHDILGDARGFSFAAFTDGQLRGVMGEQVRWEPGLQLVAHLPSPAEMTLLLDGRPIAKTQGREGRFDVEGKGIYRLEAAQKGRPWIYTNPVYVIE